MWLNPAVQHSYSMLFKCVAYLSFLHRKVEQLYSLGLLFMQRIPILHFYYQIAAEIKLNWLSFIDLRKQSLK